MSEHRKVSNDWLDEPFTPVSAAVTVVTSVTPPVLSKSIARKAGGSVVKRGGGILTEGRTETREIASLEAFAALLVGLGPANALAYGLPRKGDGPILSRRRFEAAGRPAQAGTRTREDFAWPEGPGIMMLDHDPDEDGEALSREDLVALVRGAAPGLAEARMLWWPSASSHICDAVTCEDLTGLRGQRLYLMVADARDVPRAGAALVDRLWATGHGRIAVSASGSALQRCPLDASVWQPERLDFAAGAACGPGLVQRRGDPVIVPGTSAIIDTRAVLHPDEDVRRAATTAWSRTKAQAKDRIDAARQSFAECYADEAMAELGREDPEARQVALDAALLAVDRRVLSADFPVQVDVGHGRFKTVSVGRILDDRQGFHGRLARDPLEPSYDGGRTTGKLYLLGARPTLHSFAHGGRTFRLIRAARRIEVVGGRTAEATTMTLEALRDDPAIYDFGGQIALVEDGRVQPLDEHALAHHLGGIVQFWCVKRRSDGDEHVDIDPPAALLRQIVSLGARRRLKALTAVITAPTLRSDGSVLGAPGFDAATGLFFDPLGGDPPTIPDHPTIAQCRGAWRTLIEPFRSFPFVDPLARGAFLAALLTGAVRASLPTAPAFAMDAPVQGSGKTLLACCAAALCGGRAPEIWPHTAGRDDEEVRKRLLSALRVGPPALIWDNVVGALDSAALAAAITAPIFTDRLLGRSETISVPNRTLLLMTGNNIHLAGDLPRRVLVCRIDPETDVPFARRFDLDPLAHVLEHRMELVVAALTLIRGRLCATSPKADGRMASFELWDDLVRQTVCWIGCDVAPGEVDDPMALVHAAQANDPEQESLAALLVSLEDVFGDRWFTAKDVAAKAGPAHRDIYATGAERALAESLAEFAGERAVSSTKSIGRTLKYRIGRIVQGLKLSARPARNGNEFAVIRIPSNEGGQRPTHGSGSDHETSGEGADCAQQQAGRAFERWEGEI